VREGMDVVDASRRCRRTAGTARGAGGDRDAAGRLAPALRGRVAGRDVPDVAEAVGHRPLALAVRLGRRRRDGVAPASSAAA
jgi:hypothetical protein